MPKKVPLFRASSGLNVALDPTRIRYDAEKGLVDLQAAVNVELDASGRISSRKGYSQVLSTGSYHSVFSAGSYALAAWNYSSQHYLIWLDASGNTGLLVELVHYNDRVCYARLGSRVYWSNGFEKGIVENKVASSWTAGTVRHKDETRTFSDPPAGHLLEIAFGRMWIAKDSAVYFSDPLGYNLFDLARGWLQTKGRPTLLRAVKGGLYVSDNTGVYYLDGTDPKQMEFYQVHPFPAILGTDVPDLFTGVSLGLEDYRLYCLFMTEKGICAAGPEGRFYNLTEDRITYPRVTSGSAALKQNRNILFLLNG